MVLTSVDRDDLEDGGAAHYAAAIHAIKRRTPGTAVEALTPDFTGVIRDVHTVLDSGLDVFAQNVETVERLTHPVRDPRAGYRQTIDVLGAAKSYRPAVLTKTSLMLGLGETDDEIRETLRELRRAAVDLLTLGQYLRPTSNHLAVERFVTPQEFYALPRLGARPGISRSACRGPWCARATARNARSRATTRDCRGERGSTCAARRPGGRGLADPPGAADPPPRAGAVRGGPGARCSASPTSAAPRRAMRSGVRAPAGIHARPQRKPRTPARPWRYPGRADRPQYR